MVAMLLNHGAVVNTPCILGWTALQEAVVRNNVEICEMLVKAGAKHNLTNMYGISALFSAAQTGQVAALRFLLKHGKVTGRLIYYYCYCYLLLLTATATTLPAKAICYC